MQASLQAPAAGWVGVHRRKAPAASPTLAGLSITAQCPSRRSLVRTFSAAQPNTSNPASPAAVSGSVGHTRAAQPGWDAQLQAILPTGFNLSALNSMEGKAVLVTGAARGIGFSTARVLAALGAKVYLADVDEPGMMQAAHNIQQQFPGAIVITTPRLDLGSQTSVHAWCDTWLAGDADSASHRGHPPPLDVLINNAGFNGMGVEPFYTNQGVAGLPQINVLGPYTLTRRLLPSLWATPQPRVVNVASIMHRVSELPQDPDFFLKDWWVGGAYRNCKHANVVIGTLLLQAAADKAAREARKPQLTAVAVDPGAVYSGLWSSSRVFGRPPGSTIISALFSTPQDACATSVHAAAGRDVRGGQYWARGLFTSAPIVKGAWELPKAAISCLDWPLRHATGGRLLGSARVAPVDIAPKALAAVEDGRGVALWDALARLAGLPAWDAGLA